MIEKIVLKNFLSYEDQEVNISGSTIAVVGENGAGKSSLLEAIPYAYYGISRDSISNMSRIQGDGSHEVQVHGTGGVVVTRGRKSGGAGYSTVHVNGELVAKGASVSDWIQDYIGMDGDTFMLTAYFGLHDVRNDTLIRVTPASRLEAMQKIADVGPYKKLLSAAKSRLSSAERDYEKALNRKENASEMMADETELKKKIEDSEKRIEGSESALSALRKERDRLLLEEEKYRIFLQDKEKYMLIRDQHRRDLKKLENQISDIEESIADAKRETEDLLQRKSNILADDACSLDTDDANKIVEDLNRKRGSIDGVMNLKKVAVDQTEDVCPLCGSPIDEHTVDHWRKEVEDMGAELREIHETLNRTSLALHRNKKLIREVGEIDSQIKQLTSDYDRDVSDLANMRRDLRKVRSDFEITNGKLLDIQEKLGSDYQQIHANIEETDDRISHQISSKASAKKEIEMLHDRIAENQKAKKIISEAEKAAKESKVEIDACKLLTEAWNRYGIPMVMIKQLMASMEDRATAVYQDFDSGRIVVQEVEDRGKPGVEFFLIDRKGQRTFSQLSAGEKVMFFISVRVAIAQIIGETRPIGVDYLILDEAMGNLSPNRRDDLVRLVGKVLKRLFPQTIMVSHTEMRDIFTETVKVSSVAGVSEIEVV
jgi:exonuclease SbcC